MNFRKITITFLLTLHSVLPSESHFSGIWFSGKKDFRNGYEFLQLSVQDRNFIFAKLSFNEERKWEETRVLGIIENQIDGKIKFKAEMCTVYTAKKLGQRWILLQGFDCDHLQLQITKSEQSITIIQSIGITESVILKQSKKQFDDTIDAIVVSEEKPIFHAWSLGMKYVKKKSQASVNGKPISILETVDSTGSFETFDSIHAGDIISIKSQKTSNLFD